jgi:adenine-specific DNA-methyltransferase
MTLQIPPPIANEVPSAYADRIGAWYWSWNKPNKALGQFFTPLSIARFMARLLPPFDKSLRVLDPGSGAGVLACAVCEILNDDIELVLYEVDPDIATCLKATISYLQTWMEAANRKLRFQIVQQDFVSDNASSLTYVGDKSFDIVVSNPPYLKLSKADERAKAAEVVVHGQPNLYALFMAIGAALLRPDGYALYITPRSYTAGPYFDKFRRYFFEKMQPCAFHLFESRRDLFGDVLQENLIILAQRTSVEKNVLLSSSNGLELDHSVQKSYPVAHIIGDDGIVHLPFSDEDRLVAEVVGSWTGRLAHYGLQISTGPVVAFRAESLINRVGDIASTHAPLFWMQNIQSMCWSWPQRIKPQYIKLTGAEKLVIPNSNYVLMRRFSAKEQIQRLVAAPYLSELESDWLGLENHLNYIYRPAGEMSTEEAIGLAVLLNSPLIDKYFRIFNGNTQVSATEIRNMPLPPLDAIIEMGRLYSRSNILPSIDDIMKTISGIYV